MQRRALSPRAEEPRRDMLKRIREKKKKRIRENNMGPTTYFSRDDQMCIIIASLLETL
jgi:hypothetical protein